LGSEPEATPVVNYSTRLLGRTGLMNVDLVLSPDEMGAVVPEVANLMSGFQYTPGKRYAEFRQGDKVAAYGLTALVAGGAGAVAAKTGLLAKAWKWLILLLVKNWKLLLVIIGGGAALLKKLLGSQDDYAQTLSRG